MHTATIKILISRARPSHSLSPIFVQIKALDSVSVTSTELSLAAQLDPGEPLAGVELGKKPRRIQACLTGG